MIDQNVIEIYDKQLRDITAIADTNGFKEICNYWERVRDTALEALKGVDEDKLKIRQLEYHIANNFLTFLQRLLDTKKIESTVKS